MNQKRESSNPPKRNVLFLCTHNSSRSIMAEAIVKHYLGEKWQPFSAGTDPRGINPYAAKVLKEIGIEIPEAKSKSIDIFMGRNFDRVITLCDDAREFCPVWPGSGKREHIGFPDPSAAKGNQDEILAVFRLVREQIRDKIISRLQE